MLLVSKLLTTHLFLKPPMCLKLLYVHTYWHNKLKQIKKAINKTIIDVHAENVLTTINKIRTKHTNNDNNFLTQISFYKWKYSVKFVKRLGFVLWNALQEINSSHCKLRRKIGDKVALYGKNKFISTWNGHKVMRKNMSKLPKHCQITKVFLGSNKDYLETVLADL